MKKKQIIILSSILGMALIGLIIIQTGYLQTAFKVRKAQFDFSVNRALSSVMSHIETQNSYISSQEKGEPVTLDTKEFSGISKEIIDLVDYGEGENNGEFFTSAGSGLKQSIAKYRRARKKVGVAEGEERERYPLPERSIESLLQNIDLKDLLKENLRDNGIPDRFEFAIKEFDRFTIMSPDFFNQESDFMYSKRMNSGEQGVDATFYLFFPEKTHSVKESMMLLLPNVIVTLILILCFVFCIFVIVRQKKLSTIKNDFINNMTHEFKTPIATISLAAQMLQETGVQESPETINHIAGIVKDESKRLTFQVEKVLQTALFTESRMKLKLKKLNLNDLIENLITKFHLRVKDKNGQLTSYLDARNDEIFGDEVHITNVVSNLLDNALKYCTKVPEIVVYTRNREEEIIISVVDNGIGIASKEQKLIFERFYRVSTGNLHDVKGFGLGLSYVKKIVEAHQGKIEIESTLKKGSRFDVILPLTIKKQKIQKTLFF